METITKALLNIHVIAGFASLILFWIPIFTSKGGKSHRFIGKIYVRLMWVVVLTAALLSIKNIIIGNYVLAAFLGFLSFITANPLWHAISILKNKKNISSKHRNIQLLFHIMIVLFGIFLIIYGIALKGNTAAILMFIFGGLGVADIRTVIKSIKNPKQQSEWFKEHLIGMCTSAIAAYTAFLVFGARTFLGAHLSGYWSIIPWLAPTIVGTIGIRYAVSYYKKKNMISS